MKKSIASAVFIISLLLCITCNTYGQGKTKDDLLRKSKRQITTGSILVGGGAIASTAGLFMLLNEKTFDAAPTFIITGLLTAVVGTPFYVVGQINRHKANRMSFKNEPIHIPKYAGNLPRSVPSITYSIPLN
jgi:archaellum biogenesis protein FlaJ (TadC family)